MYLGRIVETAPTVALFNHQVHPYTRALLSSVLLPDPTQPRSTFRLSGEIPSPIRLPAGCFLAPRCPVGVAECGQGRPELTPVEPDRTAACFRSSAIESTGGMEELARLDRAGWEGRDAAGG
jgi:oligopeptide/dipeptide ABC transporter ATP-binding protein